MCRPTSVDPVSEIILTPLWLTNASPNTPPGPVITFNTPPGSPASWSRFANFSASSGVSLAGLRITALPASSAGNVFHAGIAMGKFQGVIIPTMPMGWRMVILNLLCIAEGIVSPSARRPSPAINLATSIAVCTSPRVSLSTLPISRVISAANSSLCCSNNRDVRNKISPRSGAGIAAQAGCAFLAAATASSRSARVDCWKCPTTSFVLAGLVLLNVLPLAEPRHSPAIKFW